jgi:hypothetical protein
MTTGPRRRHPPPPSCTNESLRLVGGFFWPSNDTGIHHRDPPPPPRQTVTTNSMNHPPPPTSLHDSLVGSFGFPSRMPASATTNESSRLVGGFLWLSTEDASIRHHQRVLMTRWWFLLAIQPQHRHPPAPTSLHDSLVGSFGFPPRTPASATTNES